MSAAILEVSSVQSGYPGRMVLPGMSCRVEAHEAVALVGPNGCGKSTLLSTIAGVIMPEQGSVTFLGTDITGMPPDRIVRSGIAFLRQSRNVFPSLSVMDNLELARPSSVAQHRLDLACHHFPELVPLGRVRAGALSGGQRRVLALAMVLLRPARLLLLDEPLAGLSPRLAEAVILALSAFRELDRSAVIIVEHRLRLVQPFVSRVIVLQRGEIAEDTSDTTILTDLKRLHQYYLA